VRPAQLEPQLRAGIGQLAARGDRGLEVAAELGPRGEPVVRLERQVRLVGRAIDSVLIDGELEAGSRVRYLLLR